MRDGVLSVVGRDALPAVSSGEGGAAQADGRVSVRAGVRGAEAHVYLLLGPMHDSAGSVELPRDPCLTGAGVRGDTVTITDPITGESWHTSSRWPKCAVHSPEAMEAHRLRTTDPAVLARIQGSVVAPKDCNCFHCAVSVESGRLILKHLADGRQHTDALIRSEWEIVTFKDAYQRAAVEALDAMGLRS